MKKKKKPLLKRVWFWLLIIFVGLPITIGVIAGITSSDEQPEEVVEKIEEAVATEKPEGAEAQVVEEPVKQKDTGKAEPSLAYMLAVIDWGIPPSEEVLARYETLIVTVDELYKEDKQQIADVAVKASQMLAEKGINEKVAQVLQALIDSMPEGGEELKVSAAEMATMYILLRTKE